MAFRSHPVLALPPHARPFEHFVARDRKRTELSQSKPRTEVTLMPIVAASASRSGEYTEAHRCRSCGRAFFGKRSWNGLNVKCPHCGTVN